MATNDFLLANQNDGQYFIKTNADYLTARNATTAGNMYQGTYDGQLGQFLVSATYYIRRIACIFDTSFIPDNALIKSAYITMYHFTSSTYNGNVMIKSGMPTYPHDTIEIGDYNIANYSGNGGSVDVTGKLAYEYSILNLNYTGLTWINRGGKTKFLILVEDDNTATQPSGGHERTNIYLYAVSTPALRLKLTVEYYSPTSAPTVGDPTYSSTKATYTKATANVTDAGGGYKERGFEYGTSEEATWAVRETGVWGATGNYSLVLPYLLPLTTYYARAYVANEYGTGYSEWTSFTTTDVPSYGLYEESNSPTICFYVRQVGGKWSKKYGPYTTDQSDIAITDALTGGSGKYQIKFETTALTGISASIMVKQDIKAY